MKKHIIAIVTLTIIAYHIGNKNEMLGMFIYAKQHHLTYVKAEFVNNVVLNYFKR